LASLLHQEELLQQEEESAAQREREEVRRSQSRRSQPPSYPHAEPPRGQRHARQFGDISAADIMPMMAATCGCGENVPAPAAAASGCFVGCQLASCFHLNCVAISICSIVGAMVGFFSGGGSHRSLQGMLPFHPGRRHGGDEEESDEDPFARGLAESVVGARTVEHVYSAGARNSGGGEQASPGSGDDESKCMVCMEQFADGETLRTLPCLHRYHRQCVDLWLQRSSVCPICKRDVTDTSVPATDVARSARDVRQRPRGLLSSLAQRARRAGQRRNH
jgi:hypothetical protein